jgi:hypothetical protein
MSLILQISALFNDYDIYKKLNTVHVCIYSTTHDNIFEVLICETDKITVTYILRVLTTVTTLKTFTITKISLDTILGPLYDREFTIKLFELTNYQLILISRRFIDIRVILRFQINENNIEIYKELSPFPEIYYKKLTDIVELIKYKLLSETYDEDDEEIIKTLTDKCESLIDN